MRQDQYLINKSPKLNIITEEKLGHGFGNSYWCQMFPKAKVENLVASGSDHSPILLIMVKMAYRVRGIRFWFETSWLHESSCKCVVQSA